MPTVSTVSWSLSRSCKLLLHTYKFFLLMITSTSFHSAVTSWLTQWEVTALSCLRRRQPALPKALTYRRESDLMFIQATGFILDIRTSSLVVQSEAYRSMYWSGSNLLSHFWCQSTFSAADMTLEIRCLIWRYGKHLSQCSVPLCGSLTV